MTERHARIGEIEWAFWAATSFGLAFKNIGEKKEEKKEVLTRKEKKKRGAELKVARRLG